MDRDTTVMRDGYPHAIVETGGIHQRWEIRVSNEMPVGEAEYEYEFGGPGAVDASGRLTSAGRALVVAGVRPMQERWNRICLMWSPTRCTWLLENGTIEGDDPPEGRILDRGDHGDLPVDLVPGTWITAPLDATCTFIFLRRLAPDRVEVASAENMILDRLADVPRNELGGLPSRHRGVLVTGVNEDCLLGPPQPTGDRARVVAFWPQVVGEALAEVAECPIPFSLVETAWRSIQAAAPPVRRMIVECGDA